MTTAASQLQQSFDRFAAEFALPLARGGVVRVDRALGPGVLDFFAYARPSDTNLAWDLYEAWVKYASDVTPKEVLPYPDPGAMALSVALYDIFVLTDPRMSAWPASRARRKVAAWIDAMIETAGPPTTRESALARHAAIGRFFDVCRQDEVVHTWAYTHRFSGRRPPQRLTAWPSLRRVHVDRTKLRADVLLGVTPPSSDARPAESADDWPARELPPRVAKLLVASPVTDLLTSTRAWPPFWFGPISAAVLEDARLRVGVAQLLLLGGMGPVVAPLGRALVALVEARAPARALASVLRFLYELHVLAIVDRGESDKEPPVSGTVDRASAAFLAVLPAIAVSSGGFGEELTLGAADEAELRVRSALLARMAGDEMVAWLGEVASSVAAAAPDKAETTP